MMLQRKSSPLCNDVRCDRNMRRECEADGLAVCNTVVIPTIHWSLKGMKSPVYHTSYTGNIRIIFRKSLMVPSSGKGQLVVKVDDLLSQQTRNHQPDTRPVIMHLSLTWQRVRAANARNTQGMCH